MNPILIGTDNPEQTKQVIEILVKSDLAKENKVVVMSKPMYDANILAIKKSNNHDTVKDDMNDFLNNPEYKENALLLATTLAQWVGEDVWTSVQKIFKLSKWTHEEAAVNIKFLEAFGYIVRDPQFENNIKIIIDPTSRIQQLQKEYLKAKFITDSLKESMNKLKEETTGKFDETKIMPDHMITPKETINIPMSLEFAIQDKEQLFVILNTLKEKNPQFEWLAVDDKVEVRDEQIKQVQEVISDKQENGGC